MKHNVDCKRKKYSAAEIERLEDELDIAEAAKAMAEPGPNIPWDHIKKELGLAQSAD